MKRAIHIVKYMPTSFKDPFLSEQEIFSRSANSEVMEVILQMSPVQRFLRGLRNLFRSIDIAEPAGEQMARLCWRLRASVLTTPLSFSAPQLNLTAALREIGDISARMPGTSTEFSDLLRACDLLFSLELNPKGAYIHQSILGAGSGQRIGLLSATAAGRSADWEIFSPSDYRKDWDVDLSIIRSRRDLKENHFDTLIVPTGLRWCSAQMIYDIFWRGLASQVQWVRYGGEAEGPVERIRPVEGEPFTFAPIRKRIRIDIGESDEPVQPKTDPLDIWAATEYWNHIRPGSVLENPVEETKAARFVIFGNGMGAFLPADGRALEISDLIGSASGEGEQRVAVQDLEAGDTIVLRTSGTEEEDVIRLADRLMQKDGRPMLRLTALDWKPLLQDVILKKGSKFVASTLVKNGGQPVSPAYLSNWAGNEIMAPQRFEMFSALLLSILPFSSKTVPEHSSHIRLRWNAIENLKSYHHRAGQEIRQALLTKIRSFAKAGAPSFDTDVRITIPGILGAEIALLRVIGVDPSVIQVPRSHLHRLQRIPEF